MAFLSFHADDGGGESEELWSQTAVRLRERGDSVFVGLREGSARTPHIQRLEAAGCELVPFGVGAPTAIPGFLSGLRRRFRESEPALAAEERWLEVVDPDLVVLNLRLPTEATEVVDKVRERDIPYALIVHAASEAEWPSDVHARRMAENFKRAEATYFVSQGNLRLVRRQVASPIRSARLVLRPFSAPYEARLEWPGAEEGYRFACVGRLQPDAEGQDLIFEVLRSDKWRSRPVTVTFYGAGPSAEALAGLARMYRLPNVEFAARPPNAEAIWYDNHLLLLPSRYSGLPVAVVDAMLCGRPCVVTDVGGNAELMHDNVSGFVAVAATPELLDEAMERAWVRRDEWPDIGRRAARAVREIVPADPAGVFADELEELFALRRSGGYGAQYE